MGASAAVILSESRRLWGRPYVYAHQPPPSDPNPPDSCCSGFTRWATGRGGAYLPAGSWLQYGYCRDHGTLIPYAQALWTPAALLFMPQDPSQGFGPNGHVAFSLGNGRDTSEARGRAWGIGSWAAPGRGFSTLAALIPGVDHSGAPAPPPEDPMPSNEAIRLLAAAGATDALHNAVVSAAPDDEGQRIRNALLSLQTHSLAYIHDPGYERSAGALKHAVHHTPIGIDQQGNVVELGDLLRRVAKSEGIELSWPLG